MKKNLSSRQPNISEQMRTAQLIYEKLGSNFAERNNGKYIAVETISGDHFIGNTKEEAVHKANQKYPGKVVFIRRIGALERVSFHSPITYFGNQYARIL